MRRFRRVLLALGAVFILATGCSTTGEAVGAKAVDGVYTSVQKGLFGDVKVEVTIADDRIAQIRVIDSSETPAIGGDAMKSLIGKIVDRQSIAVDTVSGASFSSKALWRPSRTASSRPRRSSALKSRRQRATPRRGPLSPTSSWSARAAQAQARLSRLPSTGPRSSFSRRRPSPAEPRPTGADFSPPTAASRGLPGRPLSTSTSSSRNT